MDQILEELRALRQEVAEIRNRETMDTAGAARYLSCSAQTIRSMVHRGELPALQAGTSLRFRKCDLDALTVRPRQDRVLEVLRSVT